MRQEVKRPVFQAGNAEDGVLGEGDARDGEEFLGIGGLVELDEGVAEVGDVIGVLGTEDGVRGGGEAVFAGVLSGTGFAIGGARAGGISGVGAIGCELRICHNNTPPSSESHGV